MIPYVNKIVSRFLSSHVTKHDDHSWRRLFVRTISAQLHIFGLIAALAVTAYLTLLLFKRSHDLPPRHWVACFVFSISGLLVFASSSLLHIFCDGFRISKSFYRSLRFLDHASIYLFIAGCYTVFVFNAIQPPWDSIILFIVWITAILGLFYSGLKHLLPKVLRRRWISTGFFLALGWTILIRLPEAWQALSGLSKLLLVAGGFFYTLGACVFATRRPNLWPGVFGFHEIWHVAVLLGYAFHAAMVLNFYR